nr:PHP domain-containing protein [Oxalobacteraceae bacterium]
MSPLLPDYAELQCASNFSFLRGASHPEQLVARAAELGYSAIAITDECSVAGVVRAHSEAKRQGLSLIIGSQFRVIDATGAALRLIALAMNRDGYGNLCELITLARSRVDKGEYLLHIHDLTQPVAPLTHLRGLPNCIMLLAPGYCITPDVLRQQLDWMRHTFGPRAR